nr:MAG TPA: hypothetical protein [Caudoviricetes sp.]
MFSFRNKMNVVFDNGDIGLVIGDNIYTMDGNEHISNFNNNLENLWSCGRNINEIYDINNAGSIIGLLDKHYFGEIIWKREN